MTKQKTEAQYYSDESLPQKFANPVNLYNHYWKAWSLEAAQIYKYIYRTTKESTEI